jgi:hypothetical protein
MAPPVGRRGNNLFKQKDGLRVMKIARDGGMKPAMLEIATKDGTTYRVYDLEAAAAKQARKDGFSTYLTGIPWSEDFMRQYAAALDGVQAQASNLGAARTIPGSFDALCVSYYRSPEFRGLKASTQTTRRNIIERFRKEHGRKPIARLERAHIKDIIGAKAETPEAANNLLKVLRVLLDYAVSIDMLTSNPAIGVKRYKSRGDGIHTWSEAEIGQFEAAYPIGTKEQLAFALAIYTGQRVATWYAWARST